MAHTARDIAKAFINKTDLNAIKNGEGLSPLKLQKLLFFAQEEHLHRLHTHLFEEEIEAREQGPLVKEVWNAYRHYGNSPITEVYDPVILEEEARRSVDIVWEHYGEFEEWFLHEVTQSYDIWHDLFFDGSKQEKIIHKEQIKAYKEKIEEAKKKAEEDAHQRMDAFFELHDVEEL